MAKAKVGRPRSEKAQEAILNATHELLHETRGSGLTVEAIARRAGVGKPTIYRRWPALADIVLDALLRQADSEIPVPQCATFRETLNRFLRLSMQSINKGAGVHLRFLMAQAQRDVAFHDRFRDNLVAKRRAALMTIFLEGVANDEISSDQNLDLLVDMVFGAMWYRLLTGHAPMDEDFADELTEAVVRVGT